MMEWLTDPHIWASLLTLTALEIVLGIDNIVFIAILAGRLPKQQQPRARRIGLALALISRLALLASIAWIVGLTQPVFSLFGHDFSWRDVILISGGFFLLYKSTKEIHHGVEGKQEETGGQARVSATFLGVVSQIMVLDIVFSLDSVITAVGMADQLWVMATAVVIAVGIMLLASETLAAFVEKHPTGKMLALAFLLLIGMTLVADGFGFHVPKGYIYTAIAFSVGVEFLNQLATRHNREEKTDAPARASLSPENEKQS